jgi:hypothetical protein
MVASPNEKSLSLGPFTESPAPSKSSTLFPVFSPLANAYSRLSSWRTALGLPNPGSVENLQKEVKSELFAGYRSFARFLTGRHSNAFEQFHLRRRAGRPYERTIDGSGFPGYPLIPISITIRTSDLLVRCVIRKCKGVLREPLCDLSIFFTVNVPPKRSSFKETSTTRAMFPVASSKTGQHQIPPRCKPKYVAIDALLNHLLTLPYPSSECNPAIL